MDAALNIAGDDIDLTTGDLRLLEGDEAIAQSLRIGLRFFLAEWFLDLRIGVPYFQEILGEKQREPVLRSIFREAILITPGIVSLTGLSIDYDPSSRILTVEFSAQTQDGGTIDFSEELILP